MRGTLLNQPHRPIAKAMFFALGSLALAVWLLGPLVPVLLLAFLGVLLGLFLRGVGNWVAEKTGLAQTSATALICLLIVALAGGFVVFAAPNVSAQIDELSETLPLAAEKLAGRLKDRAWGRQLWERLNMWRQQLDGSNVLARAGGLLSGAMGAIAGFIVFVFVGLFTAFDPSLYRSGFLKLIPPKRRARADAILTETGTTLHRWMLGKTIAMAVIGILTWIGLFLLGIPMPLTLAILASLLTFIPNFGPILAAVPAVLLGSLQGTATAAYVAGLYLATQTVESYVLTPMVQKRTTSLPPAITLLVQVLMGTIAGGLGLVVATPLTAASIVVVKRIYVDDVLDDPSDA